MPKKCLSKSKIQGKNKTKAEQARVKSKAFRFEPGTVQTFKIKSEDIGNISSITLEVRSGHRIIYPFINR